MKALVTGASGFIGANVVRALLDEGYEVRALVRPSSSLQNLKGLPVEIVHGDLREPPSLAAALRGQEVLFHVAASYTFWSAHPRDIYDINVQGTANLLEAALAGGVSRVVYTSSESTVHIARRGASGTEAETCRPEEVAGDYKKSKVLAELTALDWYRRGLPLVVVNPTTPVGAFDARPTPTGRIVVDFLKRRMPAYVDTGLNLVDVKDVARGHVLAATRGRVGERYILGNQNLTLKDILDMLAAITGIPAPTRRIPIAAATLAAYASEFFSGRLLHQEPRIPVAAVKTSRKLRYFDCSKAVKELGLPQSPLNIAIERAVGWFRENGYVSRSR